MAPKSPIGAETVRIRPDRAASAARVRQALIRAIPPPKRDWAVARACPLLSMVRRGSGVRVPASALGNRCISLIFCLLAQRVEGSGNREGVGGSSRSRKDLQIA